MIIAIFSDNVAEIVEFYKLLKTHPGFSNKANELSKQINNDINVIDKIPEEAKSRKHYCAGCGKDIAKDDSVLEYKIRDGKDNFSLFYHNECRPKENEFEQFDNAELVDEQKSNLVSAKGSIKKKILNLLEQNPGGLTMKQVYTILNLSPKSTSANLNHYSKSGLIELNDGLWRVKR